MPLLPPPIPFIPHTSHIIHTFRSLPVTTAALKEEMRTAGAAAAAAAARLASASYLLYEDLLKRKEDLEVQADEGGLQQER